MRLGLQETRYRAVVERLLRRLRPIRADTITKQVPKKLYKSRLGTLRLLRDVVETSSRAVIPPVLRSQAVYYIGSFVFGKESNEHFGRTSSLGSVVMMVKLSTFLPSGLRHTSHQSR